MRLRERVIFVVFLFGFVLITIYSFIDKTGAHTGAHRRGAVKKSKQKKQKFVNTSCHYSNEEDALLAVENTFQVPNKSIFFIETSCNGTLNPRQACSIESTARAHPQWQINVFFCSPISLYALNRTEGSLVTLQQFENVKFGRIHLKEFTNGTPLAGLVNGNRLNNTLYPLENISNCLRLLSLYKWGGIYLDTDVIVTKSLEHLGANWVGREDACQVNTAVLAISKDEIGTKLVKDLIEEFRRKYKPNLWGYNGPKLLARVLAKKWCLKCGMGCKMETVNTSLWSGTTCRGIEVYNSEYFYPLHYSKRKSYFKAGDLPNVQNAYTHHLWNRLTYDMKIEKDSPYAKMAQKFCPTIYEKYKKEFGD